jgi:hypothetical protein
MKYLALCLCELVSLVDADVLFLASLTTTHGEAVLPTSTAQRGGLRRTRRSLGLRSGDLIDQACLQRRGALYSIGVMSSDRMTLSLSLSQG